MIRFYLGERHPEQRSHMAMAPEEDECAYVLEHLGELVVKEVHGSGGYECSVRPKSTKEQIAAFADKIREDPSNYIAQPTLALVDLSFLRRLGRGAPACRPAALLSCRRAHRTVLPGGLTRVALREGSLPCEFLPGRRRQGHLGDGE